MDNNSSSQSSLPHSKNKFLFIGGIFLVVVVLVILSVVFMSMGKTGSSSSKPVSETSKLIPAPTQVELPSPPFPSVIPTSWYTIKTQHYLVTVPSGWAPVPQPFAGGVSVVMRPPQAGGDPILVVESYDATVDPTGKEQMFEAMGMQKNVVMIQGVQAVKLSGTWGSRSIDNKTFKTPTQERILFIPNPKSLYVLKLYYSSPYPDAVYDELFDRVAASFAAN